MRPGWRCRAHPRDGQSAPGTWRHAAGAAQCTGAGLLRGPDAYGNCIQNRRTPGHSQDAHSHRAVGVAQGVCMSVHEQFAEDLALYALRILPVGEGVALTAHVEGCAECRRELERLRGDMALMSLSAAGPKPPLR